MSVGLGTMNESVVAPAPTKRPASNRGTLLILIIAIVLGVAAAYEYRHGAILSSTLAQTTQQVTMLQAQADELREQLTSANTRVNELQQRNMPVTLIFRRASSGNGLITVFKNNAPSQLDVSVLLNNPVTHHSREANLSIPANGTQSIGDMEGWVFESGQHIRLTNAQFGSVDYVVPEQP